MLKAGGSSRRSKRSAPSPRPSSAGNAGEGAHAHSDRKTANRPRQHPASGEFRTLLGLGLLLLASGACAAAAVVELPPPGTDGWKPLLFPKIARHTTYTAVRLDGREAVRAVSDCSASALTLPATEIDLQRTPRLRWTWKVERGLTVGGERARSGDDFAARVYVMFRFDSGRASFLARLEHRLASAIYGEEVPGHAINYVWSSDQPRGATWRNPYTADALMVSMGRGAMPKWTEEEVDVVADHQRLFGASPAPLLAVAVMTDSDNTCARAIADYASFRFLGRDPAEE